MSTDLRRYEVFAQTKAFARHVETAQRIMRNAAKHGPLVVAVSWGKDSVAMAHLALETLGKVPLFYMVSRTALLGWEPVQEYFAARTTLHLMPPARTMAETVALLRDIGLPNERSGSVQHSIIQKQKGTPARAWVKEHGFAVEFLGLRIAERGPRAHMLRARGPIYEHSAGITICCPLAYWSNEDIWAYIASRGVPYNHRVYDAETHGYTREKIRNGGYLYTDGAGDGWCAWLRHHFPEQWEILASEFPQVRAYS